MWIVQLALKHRYTFVVMSILIVVLGTTAISQMRTDIFPEIEIPVVTVIWTYKGMETSEVERRITTYSEYAITSNVNDIKRVESQTLNGVSVIRIHFHPSVDIGTALSQVTSTTQSIRALIPPGIQPPVIDHQSDARRTSRGQRWCGRVGSRIPAPISRDRHGTHQRRVSAQHLEGLSASCRRWSTRRRRGAPGCHVGRGHLRGQESRARPPEGRRRAIAPTRGGVT